MSPELVAALFERMLVPDPELRAPSVGAALDGVLTAVASASGPAPAARRAGEARERTPEDAAVRSLRGLSWALWGVAWIIVPVVFGKMLGRPELVPPRDVRVAGAEPHRRLGTRAPSPARGGAPLERRERARLRRSASAWSSSRASGPWPCACAPPPSGRRRPSRRPRCRPRRTRPGSAGRADSARAVPAASPPYGPTIVQHCASSPRRTSPPSSPSASRGGTSAAPSGR